MECLKKCLEGLKKSIENKLLLVEGVSDRMNSVQILVSTMNQTDYTLLDKMRIFSDAIVINQCGNTSKTILKYNGHMVSWYNCDEKGVGLSRNMALMKATAEICVFADDDMVYYDNSLEVVCNGFKKFPKADLIAFNVDFSDGRPRKHDTSRKLKWWNTFKYGAVSLAIKREQILRKRISFSLLFGGGAKYSSGEDTLFLADCLKNGLQLYANDSVLGNNMCGKSTWFKGYNKKFFYDKGVLIATIFSKGKGVMIIYYWLKFSKYSDLPMKKTLLLMYGGMKGEKTETSYSEFLYNKNI